ncbi:S-adenosyl-L-methionine-dependent methyltransferase [Aspergillus parasiticus]|uniref:S-adenosyl-L-methionine-dependent methyltransferase n=1 Tax=Aspergillus parasiticus TaxID=5067 RepID=A0A5N6DVP0_ASPPA|nr:S-adenosyl-L-methionine-dependent methyltransferase [Aspergillus parasiticus]
MPLTEADSFPHPRVGERSHEAGQETKLLHFIYAQPNQDDIRGRPQKVLDLRNKFEEEHYMMTVGAPKGKMVTDLIDEIKPKTMIELGCYMGYSATLFGDALAGLRDFVRVIVGRRDVSLDRLYRSGEVSKIELMFLDHYKPAYLTDLKLGEHHGMIVPGLVLAADNVLYPGNPPYLEYVRSSVEQKRETAKGGPMKGYNVERISERQVNSYMPEGDTPAFEVIGNPNLVYQSVLRQPEGCY